MTLTEARAALNQLARAIEKRPGRVHLEFHGPVAMLTVDNPSARNAFTLDMMTQLADAVIALDEWEGAALVLRSSDPAVFCAGGHLGQVKRALKGREEAHLMATAMSTVLDTLLDLPIVSVAVLGGAAIGGGAELATACDFRVASPSASIHFVQSRLGITTGWGGAGRLVRHVGRRRALWMLLDGEPVDAESAREWGLVDAIHEDAGTAARALLDVVTARAPAVARSVKRQVVGDDASSAFAEVWGGPSHREALEALRRHE